MSNLPPRNRPGEAPEPALPPELAARLRALDHDVAPMRDLWPGIACRLPPRTQADGVAATAPAAPELAPPSSAPELVPPSSAPVPVPATAAPAPRRGWQNHRRRRNAGYAAAAAVVLAVAVGWQLLPVRLATAPVADPTNVVATGAAADADAPLLRAADALAREYQGALREVRASAAIGDGGDTVLAAAEAGNGGLDAELERSAAEVRAALARDPDALHLFHRLQRIYAHRLALNLRQA